MTQGVRYPTFAFITSGVGQADEGIGQYWSAFGFYWYAHRFQKLFVLCTPRLFPPGAVQPTGRMDGGCGVA